MKKVSESIVKRFVYKILFIYIFIIYSSSLSKFGTYNLGLFGIVDKYGKYSLYFFTGIVFIFTANKLVKYKGLMSWGIFLWCMCIGSIIVSVNPGGTIILLVNLVISIFWAYWFSMKFTTKEFYGLLLISCFCICLLQYYFMIFYPQYSYSVYLKETVLSGTFYQKNNSAIFMAFSVIVSLFSFINSKNKRIRVFSLLTFLSAICIMIQIKSVTSLVSCITACLVTIIFSKRKSIINFVFLGLTLNIGIVYMAVSGNGFLGGILNDLGRDGSLTGRAPMWKSILTLIKENLFFGYGYETFWIYNLDLRRYVVNNAGGAHNGVLELLLGLGLIGTIWFFFLWVRYGRELKIQLIQGNKQLQFQYAYMVLLLTYIISERTFGNSSYQTLIFAWCIINVLGKNKIQSKELNI
ncbi:O-antigen ligase family protein [Priestia megaterium]|uniref:O-antigen ligase family protein n=1 Tax=Priestia megaterium TaxID=1404 RepID=UPI001C2513EB|nr:O-antigen ligase family protein [Priestia megaterium]MBU8752322.1 O-antigen ligase family protein [Priestia megaterium]